MTPSPRDGPTRASVRRLVEAYTPDGTLGRLSFGAITGPVGLYALIVAVGFLLNPALVSLLVVPTAAITGALLTLLAVLAVWPVYLSAIGRLDAPEEYPGDESPSAPAAPPAEELKRRYERGELSEAEFERELEALFADRSDVRSPASGGDDRLGEPEPDR